MNHLPWSYDVDRPQPGTPYLCAGFEHYICDDPSRFDVWPAIKGWSLNPAVPLIESARQFQGWIFFGFICVLTAVVGSRFELEDYILQSDLGLIDSRNILSLICPLLPLRKSFFGRIRGQRSSNVYARVVIRDLARKIIVRHATWLDGIIEQLNNQTDGDNNPWDCELFNVFWSTVMLLEWSAEILGGNASIRPTFRNDLTKLETDLSLSTPSIAVVEELALNLGLEQPSTNQGPGEELHIESPTATALAFTFFHRSRHLAEALRMLGRCPSLLRRPLAALDLYRLLACPCDGGVSHSNCSLHSCKAFDICEETYQPQHTKSCTQHEHCPLLRIDHKVLETLVNANAHAVVRSRLNEDGLLNVEIIDGTEIQYVTAISHVWAGGLGNFKENSHHQCQLKHLHERLVRHRNIRQYPSVVFYWLDTLCVPARKGELKTKAIDTLAYSYAKCQSVLVLDPELCRMDTSGLDAKQVRLSILNSPWMGRSWTLQEAALSVDLRFEFADRLVDFAEVDLDHNLSHTTMLQSLWNIDVSLWAPERYLGAMQTGHANPISRANLNLQPGRKFITVWNELCNRKSTKPEDVAAILAIFLGRSAGELLALSHADRICALLKTQTELPVSILFVPVDSNDVSWHPKPPIWDGPSSLLTSASGSMRVGAGSHFQITEMQGVTLFRCTEPLPMGGRVFLHDIVNDVHLEVFLSEDGGAAFQAIENSFLLLSPPSATRPGSERDRGLVLIKTVDDETGIHTRFFRRCTWQKVGRAAVSYLLNNEPSSSTSCRSAGTNAKDSNAMIIHQECIRIARPLTLDMGLTQPELEWSRPAFYPFIGTALDTARMLNLFSLAPLITYPWPIFCSIFFVSVKAVDTSSLPIKSIAQVLCGVCMIWLRILIARREYYGIRALVHRNLQRIWAVSFKPVQKQTYGEPLFYKSEHRLIVLVCVFSGMALLSGVVCISFLFKEQFVTCRGTKGCFFFSLPSVFIYPDVSGPLWFRLIKPGIVATTGELFIRLLILAWCRPWPPSRAVESIALPGGDFDPRTLSNKQHDWKGSLQAVLMACGTVLMLAFFTSFVLPIVLRSLLDGRIPLGIKVILGASCVLIIAFVFVFAILAGHRFYRDSTRQILMETSQPVGS